MEGSVEQRIVDIKRKCLVTAETHQHIDVLKKLQEAGDLHLKDVGDGNLNEVFIVSTPDGATSVCLKHAMPYMKILGPSYPLSTSRLKREYDVMVRFCEVCPGFTPMPYAYSNEESTILMEDLSDYEVMRFQLIRGEVDKVAVHKLASNIGRVHRETHVATLPKEDFEAMKLKYCHNEMIELTKQYIFTRPFDPNDETNIMEDELKPVAQQLYNDSQLLATVQHFLTLFLEKKECLVHGDLHTGSVMVKDGVPKVIDSEFGYVGPCGLDVGFLIANYIMAYHRHMLTPEDNDSHRRVAYKLMDAVRDTVEVYIEEMTCYYGPSRESYVNSLMSDITGFTGMELVRRVLGVCRLPDTSGNASMEKEVLDSGLRLLKQYSRINNVGRLLMIALMLC